MVLRLNNNLDIGPAQRSMAAAAELSIEAARARGAGWANLGAGIASGVNRFVGRKDEKRREAESSRRFDAELSERQAARADIKAERATDNARAERFHQDTMDHQNAAMAYQMIGKAEGDMRRAEMENDPEGYLEAEGRAKQWGATLMTTVGRSPGVKATISATFGGGCADGTCTLPGAGAPKGDGKTDFQRDVPMYAGDDKARADLGYRPDGSRQPSWGSAVPKGSIEAPAVSAVPKPAVTLDDAIRREAEAKARLDQIEADAKRTMSPTRREKLRADEVRAAADHASAKALAATLGKAEESKLSKEADGVKRQQLRASQVNEFRTKLGAYGIKPTSEDMKRLEPDLMNPNNVITDVDALIEKHFPGAKAAHEAKYAKPSADRRTPEEQAKYEADLEVARKASGSPKASKPKDDDTLTKAEDADLSARQKAADAAEKDAVEARDEFRRLNGDTMDPKDPAFAALSAAAEKARKDASAVRSESSAVANFRKIEASERAEMADDERAAFDRLTPKQKREYIAGRRERKGRGG